ncbi:MAG: FecR domain-containing protein [Bryobacterales bacterium]|nr:FecR domain-containing protein [Bryobacterales bacterium]
MLRRRASIPARWAILLTVAAIPACLRGESDPAARVVSLTGQVSVLRDSGPWVLNQGDSIKPRQIIITGADGFAVFQVADGSTFEVYPNSRLVFRDNPGNWKDLLDVFIGKVKLHVQRFGGQPNHNRVRTPTAVISVRGTIFNVDVEGEEATTVLVEEGQVEVRHMLLPQGSPKLLNAGEWIRVYKNQPLAAKGFDKGSLMQRALNAVREAIWVASTRTSGGTSAGGAPVPGGGASPPPVGDEKSPDPPPAPPPPAAPPN